MRLAGLQKLTLLDYPGLVACTVFTPGCNFCCPYCHNASLVLPDRERPELDEAELLDFLARRRGVLDGVVVTGGEPLLHDGLPDLLRRIRGLGYRIKLDTNGSRPAALQALVDEKLIDYAAMDIKSSPEEYAAAVGWRVDLPAVEASKELLLHGSLPYEFRTTVVRGLHTAESLVGAARWIAGARAYYLQQYRDSGDLISPAGLGAYSDAEMRAFAEAVRPYVPAVQLRGV